MHILSSSSANFNRNLGVTFNTSERTHGKTGTMQPSDLCAQREDVCWTLETKCSFLQCVASISPFSIRNSVLGGKQRKQFRGVRLLRHRSHYSSESLRICNIADSNWHFRSWCIQYVNIKPVSAIYYVSPEIEIQY